MMMMMKLRSTEKKSKLLHPHAYFVLIDYATFDQKYILILNNKSNYQNDSYRITTA